MPPLQQAAAWILGLLPVVSCRPHANPVNSLAIVRPFAPRDALTLLHGFDRWAEFLPCTEPPTVAVDYFLCFSQEISRFPVIENSLIAMITEANRRSWRHCFRSIRSVSANLSATDDHYNKIGGDGWVMGPNLHFLAMARAFEQNTWGKYDAWFLMEADSVPRRPDWLSALLQEIALKQPFSVLGSHFRGDSWQRMADLSSIPKAVLRHVNGNAVYNHTNPYLRVIISTFEEAVRSNGANEKNQAFDSWISGYVLEHGLVPQEIGYFGDSNVIGNYAGTVMTEAYCRNEFLVHGGYWYNDWDLARPLTLVVSDFGLNDAEGVPMLSTFIHAFLAGQQPFRQVIVMRPANAIANLQYEKRNAFGDAITFREVPRTEESTWDWCSAPVATDFFAYSSAYFSHNVRADILTVRGTGSIVAPYLPHDAPRCGVVCNASVQRASVWMGRPVTRHYDDTQVLFFKSARDAFCSAWERSPMRNAVGLKPLVDEYMAFAETSTGPLYEPVSAVNQWFRHRATLNVTLVAAPAQKFHTQSVQEHIEADNTTTVPSTDTPATSSGGGGAAYAGLAALAVVPVVIVGAFAAMGAFGTGAATTVLATFGVEGAAAPLGVVPPPTPMGGAYLTGVNTPVPAWPSPSPAGAYLP